MRTSYMDKLSFPRAMGLALIGHAVSKEDFENNGHIDVYRQW